MEFAEREIARGDKKGEGTLVLGATLALLSRWSAANRAWLPAYMRGTRSVRYSEKALLKNPKAADAYMALGTFNYAREILQGMIAEDPVRPTVKTTGQGLRQLRKSVDDGTYFPLISRLLLAGILTNDDPPKAVPMLLQLRQDLPDNPFVHIVLLSALYNTGRMEEMKVESARYFDALNAGTYSQWYKPQAFFAAGLISFRNHDWKDAIEQFGNAIENGEETNPYYTWAHLYQGYAYDAAGERRKAKKMYERVLSLKRRFASHDHARERLSKPFSINDPELNKLEV
jgi:tetratricopeptide (TPR) repeat protein